MRGNYQVRFCGGRGAAMLFSPTQQHPETRQITVCQWVEGQYEDAVFVGGNQLRSPLIPNWKLTIDQIFALQP